MIGKFWFKGSCANPNGRGHAEVCKEQKWSSCVVPYQPQSRTPSGDRPSSCIKKTQMKHVNYCQLDSNPSSQNYASCESRWLLPISCQKFLLGADSTSHRIWSPTIPPWMPARPKAGRLEFTGQPWHTFNAAYVDIVSVYELEIEQRFLKFSTAKLSMRHAMLARWKADRE